MAPKTSLRKDSPSLKPERLEDLPNIGRSLAKDLRAIKIITPAQLRAKAPLKTFHQLAAPMGRRHDPCVFYTLLSVKHFFDTGKSLPWWHFTAKGKVELSSNSPR